jgi:2-methylfumaryl-CoA isomerase
VGLYTALAVAAAVRHRDASGVGSRIVIPLANVALGTAGNLSFLSEVMINGIQRERIGNSIYGQYGQHFVSSDGASFMVVALTGRHFRDLVALTGTTDAVARLSEAVGADFGDEAERYRHRDELTELFIAWFAERSADEIAEAMSGTSVLWDRYRTFGEVAVEDRVTENPLFTQLYQPRMGINGACPRAVAAPALGNDTAEVVGEYFGMTREEVTILAAKGVVGVGGDG